MKRAAFIVCLVFLVVLSGRAYSGLEGDYTGDYFNLSPSLAPYGIDTNSSYIWAGDYDGGKVHKYDMGGNYMGNFSCPGAIGITTNNSFIWCVDYDSSTVRRYDMDGTPAPAGNFILNTSGGEMASGPAGLSQNNIYFWISEFDTPNVQQYYMDGTYIRTYDLSSEISQIIDLKTDNNFIWVLDDSNSKGVVYTYDMNFSFTGLSWDTSTLTNVRGITQNGNYFWILDGLSNENKVYTYYQGYLDIISPINTTYSSTNVFFNLTTKDPYNNTLWYSLDSGGNTTVCTDCNNYDAALNLSGGTYDMRVYANDSSNNIVINQVYFTVDATLPNITIDSPRNTTYNASSVDLNYSITDENGADWVGYSLDGQANVTLTANTTLTELFDGTHDLIIYANDTVGNMNSSVVYFTVDTPPQIIIDSPQNTSYDTNSIDLNVSSDQPVDTWQYNLNSGANVTFTPNSSITGVEGLNEIVFYANDTSGKMSSSELYFTIDTILPTITIITPENTTISDNSPELKVIFNDTVDGWYNLDERPYNVTLCDDCTSKNWAISNSHRPISGQRNDTAGEVLNISNALDNNLNDTTTYSEIKCYNAAGSPKCSDNGGNESIKYVWDTESDGNENATLYYTSGASNITSQYLTKKRIFAWNYDSMQWEKIGNIPYSETLPPTISINNLTLTPDYVNSSGGIEVKFHVFNECACNTFVNLYDTYIDFPGLLDGAHFITVYANDTFGNMDSSRRYFTVDSTPLTITINYPLNTTISDTTPLANVTFGEPVNDSWYQFDSNGTDIMLGSGKSFEWNLSEIFNDGGHNLTIWANDSVGINRSIRYWTIDTTPPTITLNMPQNKTTYGTGLKDYDITVNEALNWARVSVNDLANMTLGNVTAGPPHRYFNLSSDHLLNLSEGNHSATFYVQDLMGYESQSIVYFSVNFSMPEIEIISPENKTYGNGTLPFNMSITNNVTLLSAGVEVNGTNLTLENSSLINWHTITVGELDEGFYTATFYANGSEGLDNYKCKSFTVDTSPPYNVTLNYPPSSSSLSSGNVNFNWTSYDSVSTSLNSSLTIDGIVKVSDIATTNGTAATQIVNGLKDGSHNWSISTLDQANHPITSATYTFTIDLSIDSPSSDDDCPTCYTPTTMIVGIYGSEIYTSLLLGEITVLKIEAGNVRDILDSLGLRHKQFYVVNPNLAGAVGALGYMPTTPEFEKKIDWETWKQVETLDGSDVYTLASELVFTKFDAADEAIIARGDVGVDSIASIAYARALNLPVLLVEPDSTPEATKNALKKLGIKSTIILGGPEAVSESVEVQLPGPSRIGGKDRYTTAIQLANKLIKEADSDTIVVTDGENPDILAIMFAVKYNAPIVYTKGDEVPEVTKTFVEKRLFKKNEIKLVGVSERAGKEIIKILSMEGG